MADYAGYLVQKKTGRLTQKTPLGGFPIDFDPNHNELKVPFNPFNPKLLELIEKDRDRVLRIADEIVNGWYRPFGGDKAPLTFNTGI